VFSIYSDRRFLASPSTPHAVILAPFWGANPETPGAPETGRFDRYVEIGGSFLRLSPLADCDAAVFPQNWESAGEQAVELGDAFTASCRDARKTPVVFHGADSAEPLPIDAVVFRTSLFRSRRGPKEFALPAWSEDFLVRYLDGELATRPRHSRPVVGFCGNPADLGKPRTFRGRVRRCISPEPGMRQGLAGNHPRTRALRALKRDRRLDANLVLREGFWAGALGDPAALSRARQDYVRNMLESDYVLCTRGIGNFSYRLYETLSLGRIPVFVDTDCVLPLDFDIDWRAYCVWVDAADIERIGDKILAFHESLGDREFEERQRACRQLWETHVSPQGFFASFHRHFDASPEHAGET
jgi:Exostosin family